MPFCKLDVDVPNTSMFGLKGERERKSILVGEGGREGGIDGGGRTIE